MMSEVLFIESKDNILIDIVEQIFTYSLALTLLTALQLSQQLFLLHVTLFGIKHFFQSEKVLSCLLVQFLVDIAVNVYEPWDHDMLQGVYSPVCHLYLLIKSQKSSLERGDLNKHIEYRSELFPTFLY